MAGIYLHIPFCKQACHYCDFHFSTNLSEKSALVECLVREIELQQSYLSEPVETVYFGGGTPSLLTADEIDRLIRSLGENFQVIDQPEVTLEINPDDVDLTRLRLFRELGVNRLSIGVQSFHDDVLKFLNRAHDAKRAAGSVEEARAAGFQNISVDLIYAIPGQSEGQWRENILKAIAFKPEHISCYALTIEEKTVFGKWQAKGKFHAESDDIAAAQLDMLVEILESHGYVQYEVSNFCLPGFESRHNSSYWQRKPYLGIGPSAHSYNGISRQYNVKNNHLYMKSIQRDQVPAGVEVLTPEEKINDYLLTTLRTNWGTNLDVLRGEFNYDVLTHHKRYIDTLIREQLAQVENNTLKLTRKGKMLADKIASDLFFVS